MSIVKRFLESVIIGLACTIILYVAKIGIGLEFFIIEAPILNGIIIAIGNFVGGIVHQRNCNIRKKLFVNVILVWAVLFICVIIFKVLTCFDGAEEKAFTITFEFGLALFADYILDFFKK